MSFFMVVFFPGPSRNVGHCFHLFLLSALDALLAWLNVLMHCVAFETSGPYIIMIYDLMTSVLDMAKVAPIFVSHAFKLQHCTIPMRKHRCGGSAWSFHMAQKGDDAFSQSLKSSRINNAQKARVRLRW